MLNKLTKYNAIIQTLQDNDRNATYDEIIIEYKDLIESIRILKSCLERIVNEDNLQGEELQFYVEQLEKVNQIG